MSDADQVSQALAELWDMVKCCCDEAYTGRGLHDPYCQCDSADAVQTVADHIEALTKERDQHWDSFVHWRKEADDRSEQLAAARRDAEIAEEELGLQEEEACMMEDSYLELKKERDALEAKLAKAVEALEPFAKAAETWEPDDGDSGLGARIEHPHHGLERHAEFTFGDLRRARATLTEISSEAALNKGESHD